MVHTSYPLSHTLPPLRSRQDTDCNTALTQWIGHWHRHLPEWATVIKWHSQEKNAKTQILPIQVIWVLYLYFDTTVTRSNNQTSKNKAVCLLFFLTPHVKKKITHIPPLCNQRSSELGELKMALYLSICFSFHPENALRPYLQVGNGRAQLELGHEG